MNHPGAEELSDFLYRELPPTRQAAVGAHVEACPACKEHVRAWREVRGALQTWAVPDVRRAKTRSPLLATGLRWAVAASVLIGSGFGLAKLTAPSPQPSVAAFDAAVLEQLRTELKRDLSVQLTALHREYREGVDRQIRQIEAERLADYSGLRQDVEIVALRTQEELVRLSSATSPSPSPSSTDPTP